MFEDSDLENLLIEAGFNKLRATLTVADKTSLIATLTDYHCLIKAKAAMDQLQTAWVTQVFYDT